MNKIKNFIKQENSASYAEFSKKLTPTKYEIVGVRLPVLKKFAKTLTLAEFDLKQITSIEEILLYSYCASNLKTEEDQLFALKTILPYIENWATCDCTISALKRLKSNVSYKFFFSLLSDSRPFYVRVGIIGLMRYFITSTHLDTILKALHKINIDHYYVKMAIAWFFAELCVTDIEKAKLEIGKISDKFTRNKSISKARDSFRISPADKDFLALLRIK